MPKLAQLDKHHTGMAEVARSIPTDDNILLLFLFSGSKASHADIAKLVCSWKTRMASYLSQEGIRIEHKWG